MVLLCGSGRCGSNPKSEKGERKGRKGWGAGDFYREELGVRHGAVAKAALFIEGATSPYGSVHEASGKP